MLDASDEQQVPMVGDLWTYQTGSVNYGNGSRVVFLLLSVGAPLCVNDVDGLLEYDVTVMTVSEYALCGLDSSMSGRRCGDIEAHVINNCSPRWERLSAAAGGR